MDTQIYYTYDAIGCASAFGPWTEEHAAKMMEYYTEVCPSMASWVDEATLDPDEADEPETDMTSDDPDVSTYEFVRWLHDCDDDKAEEFCRSHNITIPTDE